MHAVDIASHLKMPRVIIPKNAGVLSALGLLLADSIKDFSKSILKTAEKMSKKELDKDFVELEQKSFKNMQEDGFKEEDVTITPSLDLRYFGQSYEIAIPYRDSTASGFSFISDFHKAHQKLYSYQHRERQVEIVNIRVKAVGAGKKIRLKKHSRTGTSVKKAFLKKQAIHYQGKKHQASVFTRANLMPGNKINGPALIADSGSTTFLPLSYRLEVDCFMNLVIRKEDRSSG
jgi:N-methylhydantoinase A/oxoprolinase/acetone carboxylase beta subunit